MPRRIAALSEEVAEALDPVAVEEPEAVLDPEPVAVADESEAVPVEAVVSAGVPDVVK